MNMYSEEMNKLMANMLYRKVLESMMGVVFDSFY